VRRHTVSELPVDGEGARRPAFRLLFVCTGNICRSAAAERLARRYLEQSLDGAARLVHVESAGTRAVVGAPVHPDTARVVNDLGGDVEGFAARRLTKDMLAEADLVLTMTTEHRTIALGLEPRALSRTFTLREAADLVRLVADAPAGPGHRATGPRSLAQRMAGVRSRRGRGGADDIADPMNRPAEMHREAAEVVSTCLDPVLQAVLADLRGRDLLPPGEVPPRGLRTDPLDESLSAL